MQLAELDFDEQVELCRTVGEEGSAVDARESLLDYARKTYPGVYRVNWHHELIIRKLEMIARGELKYLIVQVPPQTGKSELCSKIFPAWVMGKFPDKRIMHATYASSLAGEFSKAVRSRVQSPEHNAIFPPTMWSERKLTAKEVKNNTYAHYDNENGNGYYRSGGLLGGLTGFGADLMIIDDPVKNREQADSPKWKEKLRNEFDSTIWTRMAEDCPLIMIMTRWAEDDLVGYFLEMMRAAGRMDEVEVLNLPALMDLPANERHPEDPREMGESLWEGRFSAAHYRGTQEMITEEAWTSIYQQRPSKAGGGVFLPKYWRTYTEDDLVSLSFQEHFITADLGFKKEGRSWVVFGAWGVAGSKVYLLDMFRKHMSYSETREAFLDFTEKHPLAYTKLIEEAANGHALLSDLSDLLRGMEGAPAHESKEIRANYGLPVIRAGDCLIPDPSWLPWVKVLITEHKDFPRGVNDDIVDMVSHAMGHFRNMGYFNVHGTGDPQATSEFYQL